jgi:hypothetical protein
LNNCFRDALAKIVAFAAGVLLQTLSSATFMFASGRGSKLPSIIIGHTP